MSELSQVSKDLAELMTKHGDKLQHYVVRAEHKEGTEMCSIELPCRYKGKTLSILVSET